MGGINLETMFEKPKLSKIEKSEEALDVEGLVSAAVDLAEVIDITPR